MKNEDPCRTSCLTFFSSSSALLRFDHKESSKLPVFHFSRRAEQKQPAAYSQSRGQTKAQGSNLFPVRWRPKWSDVKMEERRMESASNIQLHLSVDHNLKHVFMFYNSIWVLSIKTIPNGCVDGYILSISGRQQETEQQEQFHRMGNLCLTLPPRDLSLSLSLSVSLSLLLLDGRS